MTLFEVRTPAEAMSVRFGCSPLWETQAAVQSIASDRARSHHAPWLDTVRSRVPWERLRPLVATIADRADVPDFLAPPPTAPTPSFRDELAGVRRTPPGQVATELRRCARGLRGDTRDELERLARDPEAARQQFATCLQIAWEGLVAPFWTRIRALLDRDVDERSRSIAQRGLRRALDGLDPKVRWTRGGVYVDDRCRRTVEVDERGLLLMPSAYLWPYVATVVDRPWLPAIVYPVSGIAALWQPPQPPSGTLERLLGPSRARVLAALETPRSTTVLSALLGLSPAAVSCHLLTLRDAGLAQASRHGHEVRYRRTRLGEALVRRQ